VANQASAVNAGNHQPPHGAQAVFALAVDSLKLADLQVQLLTLDVREFWAGAWRSALVLAAGSAALIAALPVAMFGVSEYLRQAGSLSIEFALLLVSGVVLIVAAALIFWSGRRLATAAQPLRRSAEELRANLDWMRSVLHDESAESGSRQR
jgi:hypothetical protein